MEQVPGCIPALSEGLFSSQVQRLKLVIPVWVDLRGAAVVWMFLWELFLQSSGAAGWALLWPSSSSAVPEEV